VISPPPGHDATAEEDAAIDYLCEEWDWSWTASPKGIVDAVVVQPSSQTTRIMREVSLTVETECCREPMSLAATFPMSSCRQTVAWSGVQCSCGKTYTYRIDPEEVREDVKS